MFSPTLLHSTTSTSTPSEQTLISQGQTTNLASPVKSKIIQELLGNFESREEKDQKEYIKEENMEDVRPIGRPIVVYDSSSSSGRS